MTRAADAAVESHDSFPVVEQLRPGIWSIPVPIPVPSLPYVLVYVFETDHGLYLVDVGWNTEEAFAALSLGLQTCGGALSDVRGVLVTHTHVDHFGLAGRVRKASGAWVAMHPADARLLDDRFASPEQMMSYLRAELRQTGAPGAELESLLEASLRLRDFADLARPDLLLQDGDRPELPGWELEAIWTPGHSPGHLCFYEPRNRVMLTGDHVLPRITPNVQFHTHAGSDPLGDYLRAIDHLSSFETLEAWPAHEHRFSDFRGRLAALADRQASRSRQVVDALASAPLTAWETAERVRWSSPWSTLSPIRRRMAVTGTMAHLRALVKRGRVREIEGDPPVFAAVGTRDGDD